MRERQIEMMRRFKRDVPFTEAVNWVVFEGLYWHAKSKGMSDKELVDRVMEWVEGVGKIEVDAFLDSIPVTREDERLSLPKRE